MPGCSVVRDPDGLDDRVLTACLDAVCFFDGYAVHEYVDEETTRVAHTGYDGYPVRRVETEDCVVLLEGHLYGVDDPDAHLRRIGPWLLNGRGARFADWLLDRDGDFLVVVVDKRDGALVVANDALGRLPTYQATVDGTRVVTRELKLVRELARRADSPVALDRLAAAQTLLFGHTLGTRTLFDGVTQVPPGSVVRLDGGDGISVTKLYEQNFGRTNNGNRSRGQNAARLASLFTEACRVRAAVDGPNVVSLSGGLDSRSVAAGYHRAGVPFTTATFDHPDVSAADVRLAREVADALGVEWESYAVRRSQEARATLLDIKQGMNHLYTDFVLDFAAQLRARHGTATHATGDGGDQALSDLTPVRECATTEALLEYTLGENRIFSVDEAAAIAGVDPAALEASVRRRLASYPEDDPADRYVHFLVRERGVNLLTNGEDRNRYYSWSVTPFRSLPFFEYAMRCPAEQKRHNDLYREFLGELSPAVLDIENADAGVPVSSVEYRLKQRGYSYLSRYPWLKSPVFEILLRDDEPHPEVTGTIRSQLSAADGGSQLSSAAIDRVLRNDAAYPTSALYHLYTLTSLAEGRRGAQTASVR